MIFSRSSGIGWLVAFLGNPGPKYASTRHNAGFLAAEALAKDKNLNIAHLRFHALTGKWELKNGETALVLKPQTYMNDSGVAVGEAARFYKVPADHILVVSDDIALPVGKLRVRTKGSAGGHNGLKSIIAHLGTDAFPRVKIGVGAPPDRGREQIDWVLGVPRNEDWELFSDACVRAASAAEDYILRGPEHAMSKYN